MLKSFACLILLAVSLGACNQETKTGSDLKDSAVTTIASADTVPAVTPPVNALDENGCDPGQGQKWSKIKKSCVILVDLVSITSKDPAINVATPAYLIFDSVRVEIFLPTQQNSIVLRKSSKPGEPDVWSSGPLTLRNTAKVFRLEDEGKLIYEGPSAY